MFGIGAGEFIIILIVGLIVFGPSKLPELGRSLGKLLREFRKAQAALSATLDEDLEPAKKPASVDKPVEKVSATPGMTVDEIIHSAKERPIVKENSNEKVSNGNPNNTAGDAPVVDARASVAGAGSGADGVDKQPKPATDGTINPHG